MSVATSATMRCEVFDYESLSTARRLIRSLEQGNSTAFQGPAGEVRALAIEIINNSGVSVESQPEYTYSFRELSRNRREAVLTACRGGQDE